MMIDILWSENDDNNVPRDLSVNYREKNNSVVHSCSNEF